MIAAALIAVAVGIGLVRLGWAGSRGVALAGWAVAVGALLVLTLGEGAWGLAMGCVAGMTAAVALVLYAGWMSPPKSSRAPREAPAITIPVRAGDIARRLAVFVLAVPIAFAAAQWFAYGVQALARSGGAADADTVALTLGLQPLAWSIVMTLQLIQSGLARMLVAPAVTALLGTMAWGLA